MVKGKVMFKRILVPLDGSSLAECVLPHIAALVKSGDPEVTLLRVLDPLGAADAPMSVDPLEWQIRKAEADNYLKALSLQLSDAGIQNDTITMEGKAAEAVIEYAHDNKIDLILMSSHGRSGISGWNVSSVVQKIILRVRTSVMIVRAYQPVEEKVDTLRYQKVMVPLDGSSRAEFVLPFVSRLVRVHQSEVLVMHIVRQPEMPRRTPLAQEDIDLLNRLVERNMQEAERYLTDLSGRVEANIQTRLVVSENVISTLHSLVEKEQGDLVILSAHGYSGDTRWPYGSVVISFIAYGRTPLLVLQDLPSERIEPTTAEIASKEQGGR
jgi:nucleotide-binding universal stress UspA family protein